MTDIPFRVYGPQPIDAVGGTTLYTAPPGTSKFFIKDITLSNIDTAAHHIHMSLGDITDSTKRVVDQDAPAATATFLRPMWLMDAGETLQGIQTIGNLAPGGAAAAGAAAASGTDATSYASGVWTPAADTLYILIQANGVASGTTALNPSSITGNGTWTLITQTTSTVAAARNVGISAWYWYSAAAGASASTTVNFASTQHSSSIGIYTVTNVNKGLLAVPPWTTSATPIVSTGSAADSVAPSSTTLSKTVSLTSKTGYVFYWCAKTLDHLFTAGTNLTELADLPLNDAAGSICSLGAEYSATTTPPYASTNPITVGPATASGSSTDARAAIAWEMIPPNNWINVMVSGIEVH